jgi:hypothetical protein
MSMSKRQTCSQEDILSTCKVRTLLGLGCRQCKSRRQCIDFKFKHNGLSPYEYNKLFKEEQTNEETE